MAWGILRGKTPCQLGGRKEGGREEERGRGGDRKARDGVGRRREEERGRRNGGEGRRKR